MITRSLTLVACTFGLAACDPSPPSGTEPSRPAPTEPSPAPIRSPATATAAPHGGSDVSGAISEQAFKRLHELKKEAAPPRRGSDLSLPGGSRAYLSLPAQSAPPLPSVVVIHEWWGLNEHIMHWADRLASEGYAALAVDLYGGKTATTPDEAMALMKSADADKARATLLDAHAFLKTDRRVQARRRGAVGWCFGGKWSLNLALAAPDLDAAVVYYGHVTTDANELAKLKTPILGIFGKRDASIPMSHVNSFESALARAGVPHRVLTYDADHAFANPSGARYDEKAAEAAWQEARAFLAQHVKSAAR